MLFISWQKLGSTAPKRLYLDERLTALSISSLSFSIFAGLRMEISTPKEAVSAYHGELQKLKIRPRLSLDQDLELTQRF